MPTLHRKSTRTSRRRGNQQRVRELAVALAAEPEQILPTLAFMSRSYPQRGTLLELVLDLRRQVKCLSELTGEPDFETAAVSAQVDQLLAALGPLQDAAAELRAVAELRGAVVTLGKAIGLQG